MKHLVHLSHTTIVIKLMKLITNGSDMEIQLLVIMKKINRPFVRFIFAEYDFVSFEYWDKKKIKSKIKTVASALLYFVIK